MIEGISPLARIWERVSSIGSTPQGRSRAAVVLLALAVVAYAVAALVLTRDSVLYLDSFRWITHAADGFSPSSLLEPYNGHLILLTRLIYAASLRIFGPDAEPILVTQIVAVAASAVLVFALARRRVDPLVALAPAVVLLFLGSTTVLLELNVAVFAQSTALGLGALLALDPGDRRGDVIGCALLLAGVLAFSLGLPFALGAAALILARPDPARRLWVVAVPLLAYGAWLAWALGEFPSGGGAFDRAPGGGEPGNILLVPNFAADSMAAALTAILGLARDLVGGASSGAIDWGRAAAVPFVLLVAYALRRGRLGAMPLAIVVVLVSYWTLGALNLGPFRFPDTERYIFPAAALLLVLAAEALPDRASAGRFALAGALGFVLVALPGNLHEMRDNGAAIREASERTAALLATAEIARGQVDDPETPVLPDGIGVADYLQFAEDFGDPGADPDALTDAPEGARVDADANLLRLLGVEAERAAPSVRPLGCAPLSSGATAELPMSDILVRSPQRTQVRLRRFASSGGSALVVPGGEPTLIAIPVDGSPVPWTLTAGGGDIRLCVVHP